MFFLCVYMFALSCKNGEIDFYVKVETKLIIDNGTSLIYKNKNIATPKSILVLDSSSQLVRFTIPNKLSINKNCEINYRESLLGGRYFEITSNFTGPDLADGDTIVSKIKLLSPASSVDKEIIRKKIEELWISVDSLLSKKDTLNAVHE